MKQKWITFILITFLFLLVGCHKKQVQICFVDWDDTIILEVELSQGETIVAPENPVREGYVFIGWSEDFTIATQDLILTAQYDIKVWSVIFQGINQEILKEEQVIHNMNATAPKVASPLGYHFTGWDKDYSQITGDLIVTAQFEKNTYLVRFVDGQGVLLKEEIVSYLGKATAPEVVAPVGYHFTGWDKDSSSIVSDITITAQFEINQYQVRFFDDQGNLLKEETVVHGLSATAPTVSNRENENFSHWDKAFTKVHENMDVVAVFTEKEYAISFYDGTTRLSLDMTTYRPSEERALPLPTKTGYQFSGWFLSEISLYEITQIESSFKGNLTLYSRWVKTEQNQFTSPARGIEFDRINKNPHSSGKGYVYQPQFPSTAVTTSVTNYDWVSSDTKVATISIYSSISIVSAGYAMITATLKADPSVVYYCIIRTSADGIVKATLAEANAPNYVVATFQMSETETIEKTVQKGGFVIAPTAPFKEGYIFTGWVGENQETIYNITKDTTFFPTYTEGQKSYAGKTISVLGDSITTYLGYIPSGFSYFYPYPTADLTDVNQTWWMQFINAYGMKLLVNNAWSGSAVAGSSSSAAHTMTRLQYLYIGEIKPEVILIFMGANDAPSPYISLTQFDEAYGRMIQNIKTSSPDSEIILCTLPSIPLYTETEQVNYNAVIQKYATENNFTLFDFSTAFSRASSNQYLVDSAHPNKTGMDKLAEVAIRDFMKAIK